MLALKNNVIKGVFPVAVRLPLHISIILQCEHEITSKIDGGNVSAGCKIVLCGEPSQFCSPVRIHIVRGFVLLFPMSPGFASIAIAISASVGAILTVQFCFVI